MNDVRDDTVMTSDENERCRAMKSTRHPHRILASLNRLHRDRDASGIPADLLICIGESATWHCHRFILAICSSFFRRLLNANGGQDIEVTAAGTARVTLSSEVIKPEVFGKVLNFIYTGVVELNTDSVLEVYTAADRVLDLPDLVELCVDYMLQTLTVDNCVRCWTFAETAAVVESSNDVIICSGTGEMSDEDRDDGSTVKRLINACSLLVQTDAERLNARPEFGDLSHNMIKVVLDGPKLRVRSEIDACEMLLRWLEAQACQPDRRSAARPEALLALIRWSGVHVDYVRSVLMIHDCVASVPEAAAFVARVLNFLETGVQFYGLRTFHRRSTGVEKCFVVFGAGEGLSGCNQVIYRLNIQQPEGPVAVTERGPSNSLASWPILQREAAAACNCGIGSAIVYVLGVGRQCSEVWSWSISAGWTRCADLVLPRSRHGACVTGGRVYALGGLHRGATTDSVEFYDPVLNRCRRTTSSLSRPLKNLACVSYRASIFVVGGLDDKERASADLHQYDTARDVCTVLTGRSMPLPLGYCRCVIYDTSLIVFSRRTCLVYDLVAENWTERRRFGTGVRQFGCAVDNGRVYVVGGGTTETGAFGTSRFTLTAEVKSIAVTAVLCDGQAPTWTRLTHLPRPAVVNAFAVLTLPIAAAVSSASLTSSNKAIQ